MSRKVKKKILDERKGGFRAEYAILYKYAEELERSNMGSTIKVLPMRVPGDEKPKFKCIYICFATYKQGWKAGCRPVICFDGSSLKICVKGSCCGNGKRWEQSNVLTGMSSGGFRD